MMDLEDPRIQEYFFYLLDLLSDGEPDQSARFVLCLELFRIEFFWVHPNDERRARDGKRYRLGWPIEEDVPCTVLEAMIAMASKMDETAPEDPVYGRLGIRVWFDEMITNLGLGEALENIVEPALIHEIIFNWLSRNGKNTAFPTLQFCVIGSGFVEFWYEMCAYLKEKYF